MRRWLLAALVLMLFPAGTVDSATSADLRPFIRGSWQQLRKLHAGEPIVAHFWGLTCGPCLAELPDWAKEAKARADLHLVLIDADPFGDDPASAWKALAQSGLAKEENWIFADSFGERLRYEIDPHWHGEMPYTLLIGRDGTVTPVTGLMDFARLKTWLDKEAEAGP